MTMMCRRSILSLPVLLVLTGMVLFAGVTYAASYWSTTLGGVFLEAETDAFALSSSEFAGISESFADENITTIAATNTGRELCNGTWQNRWLVSDSNNNDDYAVAGDSRAEQNPCLGPHKCQALGSHSFVRTGVFGANPSTDDTYDC